MDPPAIAHFLRFGYGLIPKIRVSSLDHPRNSIDLVAVPVRIEDICGVTLIPTLSTAETVSVLVFPSVAFEFFA